MHNNWVPSCFLCNWLPTAQHSKLLLVLVQLKLSHHPPWCNMNILGHDRKHMIIYYSIKNYLKQLMAFIPTIKHVSLFHFIAPMSENTAMQHVKQYAWNMQFTTLHEVCCEYYSSMLKGFLPHIFRGESLSRIRPVSHSVTHSVTQSLTL